MGFLDHSTNNIIVDAVLTDAGRSALANNDGSFQIFQFALGDDEVDYEIIEQYGRTVGKEKIEKNTPVIEALTLGSLALKHKLVSVNNEFVTHMPTLEVQVAGTNISASNIPAFNRTGSGTDKSKQLTIKTQTVNGGPSIDTQLVDSSFRVELNSIFFAITGESPDVIYNDNVAVYEIGATTGTGGAVREASFTVALKSINDTTFNVYTTSGGSSIRSFLKVTGINSGVTSTFELSIS